MPNSSERGPERIAPLNETVREWFEQLIQALGSRSIRLSSEEESQLLGKLNAHYHKEHPNGNGGGVHPIGDKIETLADAIRSQIVVEDDEDRSNRKRCQWFKKAGIQVTLEAHERERPQDRAAWRKAMMERVVPPPVIVEHVREGGSFYLARLYHEGHLRRESEVLDHCIGKERSISHYLSLMRSGNGEYFSLRAIRDLPDLGVKEHDPVLTIEYHPKEGEIKQVLGYRDTPLNQDSSGAVVRDALDALYFLIEGAQRDLELQGIKSIRNIDFLLPKDKNFLLADGRTLSVQDVEGTQITELKIIQGSANAADVTNPDMLRELLSAPRFYLEGLAKLSKETMSDLVDSVVAQGDDDQAAGLLKRCGRYGISLQSADEKKLVRVLSASKDISMILTVFQDFGSYDNRDVRDLLDPLAQVLARKADPAIALRIMARPHRLTDETFRKLTKVAFQKAGNDLIRTFSFFERFGYHYGVNPFSGDQSRIFFEQIKESRSPLGIALFLRHPGLHRNVPFTDIEAAAYDIVKTTEDAEAACELATRDWGISPLQRDVFLDIVARKGTPELVHRALEECKVKPGHLRVRLMQRITETDDPARALKALTKLSLFREERQQLFAIIIQSNNIEIAAKAVLSGVSLSSDDYEILLKQITDTGDAALCLEILRSLKTVDAEGSASLKRVILESEDHAVARDAVKEIRVWTPQEQEALLQMVIRGNDSENAYEVLLRTQAISSQTRTALIRIIANDIRYGLANRALQYLKGLTVEESDLLINNLAKSNNPKWAQAVFLRTPVLSPAVRETLVQVVARMSAPAKAVLNQRTDLTPDERSILERAASRKKRK